MKENGEKNDNNNNETENNNDRNTGEVNADNQMEVDNDDMETEQQANDEEMEENDTSGMPVIGSTMATRKLAGYFDPAVMSFGARQEDMDKGVTLRSGRELNAMALTQES